MKLKRIMFMKIFIRILDFSNYPKDSKCYYQTNMNEIGKMKNESEAKIIIEFAGLKSELYCLICIDDNGKKKKRKIVKSVVAENKMHKKYYDVFINRKIMRHTMKRIQSELHKIGTYEICKIFLSCFDDKTYILDDDFNSLTYFRKDILKNKSD